MGILLRDMAAPGRKFVSVQDTAMRVSSPDKSEVENLPGPAFA